MNIFRIYNRNTAITKHFFKVVLVSGLFLVSSCEKLLDTSSEVAISSASVFQSPSRIEGVVNGAYKSLKSANLYSGRFLMYGDLRGEEFVIRTENALTGGYVWEHNLTSLTGDVNDLWTQLYRVINNTNILIEGLKKSEGVISEDQKTKYLGEAYFIRALAYFNLVTIWGRPYKEDNGASKAIPLRLSPESTSSNNDLERSTVAQIYKQIQDDLDAAELSLPEKYSTALLNTTRAQKNTAIALKTRIYLSKGDFDNVRKEAKKIVPQDNAPFQSLTGVANKLEIDITTVFQRDYTTGESIFSMPMTAADPPAGLALANVYYYSPDFVLNSGASSIIADNGWTLTDKRREFVTYNATLKLNLLAKYLKRNPNVDYVPVLRYAEVLLNYAEAEARSPNGSISKAVALLKSVRSRSDASYVFPPSALISANFLTTIRKERRIEFLGEGLRSIDILRDNLTFPTKPSLSSFTAREVKPIDVGYVFPLPNSEIITNKLLTK